MIYAIMVTAFENLKDYKKYVGYTHINKKTVKAIAEILLTH